MKQLITILTTVIITLTAITPQLLMAQTPDNMNYQAVIRDIDGNLMANHEVGIQISIFQGSVDDPPIYVERQYPTTNANGLVTLIIGDGNVIVGDYSTINWANLPFFLRTETDMEGGENYTILGDSDMLSVSYALHAKTADSVIGGVTEIDPVFAASVAGGITETDTAYWNDKLDVEVDGSIINELQFLHIVDETIFLSNGGQVDLPPEIDPVFDNSVAGGITAADTANWNAGGGAETDPIFDTSVAGGITAADTANWNAGAGAIEINDLTDGKTGGNSVFLGEGAGAVDDLSDNHNVFVGYKAGNANTTGTENTATGTWALKHNITGIRNTANGSEALFSNTTGNYNTATGVYTLHENTTGIENTAMGFQTLGYNTEGANNTASGYWALVHNTTGDGNTASGYTALKTNTTGSNNTAIGYEADVSSDNLTNATAIGYNAKVDSSNSLVLGGTGTDAVNVGIGTSSPHETAVLDMVSTTKGMLIPRMTESEKNTISPVATGLMIYQTNGARGFYYYDGTVWKSIGAGVLAINDLTDGNTTGSENVFLGEGAGSKNTTGAFNTAIGAHALDSLSTGSWNTATGALALADNTTGIQNSATGFQALSSNTTGTDNTATGFQALSSNTTGKYNTATGFQALDSLSTGRWNTATGYQALRYNITGEYNTAAGTNALQTNTTGSNNTAFGYKADVSSGDLSNTTAIGNNAKVATDNSLVLGGTGADAVKVGIGTDSPDETAVLDMVSTTKGMLIPRMLEAEKTGITTPATGLMIYQTNGARGFYYYDGTAWKSIGAGVLGINDLTDGNTTGSENVFLGEGAGSKNTTGAFNTAIGAHALDSLSTGSWNTATGALALADNTTGIQNSATGFQALSSNTTGTDNTATGGQALSSNTTGNYNTATGFQALNENTEASWITATGYHALRYNTTGAENTAAGAFALQTNTTGSSNTAFGYEADVSSGDLSNATAIGYKAKVATSNSLVLGGFDETGSGGEDNSVKVGIGTDSPSATLDVVGAVQIDSTLDVDGFTYLKDDVKVDGNTLLMSDLDVAGDASIAGKVYILSTLDTYNDVTIDGALTVTQNTFLESTVEFYDDVYIDSTLNVEQSTLLHSTLKVDGAVTMSYDSGNDYYVHLDDTHYTYTTTNAGGYIYLPSATPGNKGRIYIIKSTVNSDVYVRELLGNQKIDGRDYYILNAQWEYVKVQSTGDGWAVIGQSGGGIPNQIADADNDTKVQVEKTGDEDIIRFDMAGTEHFKMDGPRLEVLNSGQSVFIGEGAGAADDLGNNHNVFVGYQTGQTNTTGKYNTGIGDKVLKSNTTGRNNVANGAWALTNNTTGDYNTAAGSESLTANTAGEGNSASGSYTLHVNTTGSRNTAMGYETLEYNKTGNENTATGYWGLRKNTTGIKNTASGHKALYWNVTGSKNTAIGADAGVLSGDLTNTTAIGYNAGVATSNSLVLGGTGADAVNVGIGTDSPAHRLHVIGDAKITTTLDVGGVVKIGDVLKLTPRAVPGSPENGDIYLSSTDNHIYCYINSVWKQLDN